MRTKLFLSFSLIFSWIKIGKLTWKDLVDPSALFFFVAQDAGYYLQPNEERWADPNYPPKVLGEKAKESFHRLRAILREARAQGRCIYVSQTDIERTRVEETKTAMAVYVLEHGEYPHAEIVKKVIDKLYPPQLCARTVAARLGTLLAQNGYELIIPESYRESRGLEHYNIPDMVELIAASTEGRVQPIWRGSDTTDRVLPFPS